MLRLLAFVGVALGCGVSIHQSILSRTLPQLPQNVTDNLSFARAGAFFPDAFYGCMDQSDAAEATHWPPFLAEGANMVRDKIAKGDMDGAANLYAFLTGVLSHQVADVSWHSLGFGQGLLDIISKTEFGGDIDDAHSTLDIGGDFIYLHRLFASGQKYEWIQESWDYNTEDILALLKTIGYDVSSFQLNYCMSRGRAALNAEMKVADPAYIHYAQKSPLLYGNLEEYFAGGIADMQSQTLECMSEFESWIHSPPTDPWGICQVFDGKRPSSLSKRQSLAKRVRRGITSLHSYYQIKNLPKPLLNRQALTLKSQEPWSHFGKSIKWWEHARVWAISSPQTGSLHFYDDSLTHKASVKGPEKLKGLYHSRFGTAMEVVKIGNKEFLAVSSPGISRIDLFTSNGHHVGALAWSKAQVEFGHLGTKLVGMNLLFDEGYLYVGAPFSDEDGSPQSGAVFIVDQKTLKNAISGESIGIDPPKIYHEAREYCQFGARLARSNLFLLIGSPGEDTVYGFDRLTHGSLLVLTGDHKSGFGGYMLATDENQIVIGAPLARDMGEQSGNVYFYENTRRKKISGDSAYSRFGHSGLLKSGVLHIGSPFAENERGVLWNHTIYSNEHHKVMNGPTPYSGAFCDSMVTNGSMVACGAPFHDNSGAVIFIPIK